MNHPFAPKTKSLFFFFSFLLLAWESMSHNVTVGVTKCHVTCHVTYSLVGFMGGTVHRPTEICISR